MKHFFDHLGDNCSRYLNLQQELKLVDTLSRAKYDDEDDKSVELVNFDNDIDTGIEYEELDDDDEGVEIVVREKKCWNCKSGENFVKISNLVY